MSLAERITNQLFFYCACCYSEPVVAIVDSRWVSRRNKKKPNQSRVIQSGEQITCTYMPCWVQLITRWRLICCPKFSRVTHRDKKLRKVTADEAWQRNFNRFVYLSYLFIFTFVWRICPVFLSDHPVHFSLVWWFLLTIAHNLFIVRLLFLHKRHCILPTTCRMIAHFISPSGCRKFCAVRKFFNRCNRDLLFNAT
jgi:hypothetical protein